MRNYLKLFCLALPISIALDASWIGVIASSFYRSTFEDIFVANPNLFAAAVFYVLYAAMLCIIVIAPALAERSLGKAMTFGAAVGFTAYMTYDLTNLATLAVWPLTGAAADVMWGTVMTSVTCGLTYIVATKVFKL